MSDVELFSACTPAQLDMIARISDEADYGAGSALCRQGDTGTVAFVIVSGEASVSSEGAVVATAGPGTVLGEAALLNGRRNATVRALTPVQAVVVDHREIDFALAAVPATAGPALQALIDRCAPVR